MFIHVDTEDLAVQVADLISAGTGGTVEYKGRCIPDAHAISGLTDGDFLAAGGDSITAMGNKGYVQDEIDEVACILLPLKDQVVL